MTGDNMFTLYVNGQIALSVENPSSWQQYGQADISAFLANGTNVLAIAAVNGGSSPNPPRLIRSPCFSCNNRATNNLQKNATLVAPPPPFSYSNPNHLSPSHWVHA